MPAVSKRQRRFMAMCEHDASMSESCPKGMSKSQMRDFAKTKEKGLPYSAGKKKRRRKGGAVHGLMGG